MDKPPGFPVYGILTPRRVKVAFTDKDTKKHTEEGDDIEKYAHLLVETMGMGKKTVSS